MIRMALAVALVLVMQQAASASSMQRILAKLAPEERAHQACAIKGLPIVKKDPRLRRADRIKSSILSRAVLAGTHLDAKGGAIRAGGHWYAVSYTCELSADYMQAQTFSFQVGKEIPEARWDELGLWP
jgi:hypothetical protein